MVTVASTDDLNSVRGRDNFVRLKGENFLWSCFRSLEAHLWLCFQLKLLINDL